MDDLSKQPVPALGDLSPSWWTLMLRNAGFDVEVVAARAVKIGTGQMGQNIRFKMDYQTSSAIAPPTFVGKFPSEDARSLDAARIYGSYRREVNFYHRLGPSCGASIPRMLYGAHDPRSERFVLIMDDVAPAAPADQIQGVTALQAGLALEEAAKLHASHWNDPALIDMEWLLGTPGAYNVSQVQFAASWQSFIARFPDQLDTFIIELGETLREHHAAYTLNYLGPMCLLHGDYRPDNIAFASEDGGRPITIFDWQTAAVGCSMRDIAYFMAGALHPDQRRREEGALLRHYHDTLMQGGVQHFDFDQVWALYRRYSVSAFSMAVNMSVMVERTARGDAMFLAVLHRAAALARDVDGLGMLRELT